MSVNKKVLSQAEKDAKALELDACIENLQQSYPSLEYMSSGALKRIVILLLEERGYQKTK